MHGRDPQLPDPSVDLGTVRVLPPAAMSAASAFHLWLGADLRVTQVGDGLRSLAPELCPGAPAFELIALRYPWIPAPTPEALCAIPGPVVLELVETGVRLQGRWLAVDDGTLVFVGQPWLLGELDPSDAVCELAEALARQGRALRETQHRIATHLRQTPLGVIDWDQAGRVVAWNPATARIFGIPADQALGRGVELLGAMAPIDELGKPRVGGFDLLNSLDRRVLVEHQAPGRPPVLCAWHNTRLNDAEGRPIGVSSILRDVTDSVRAERALCEATRLETLGLFAGGLAHDFNNLLTALVGNTDLAVLAAHSGRSTIEHLREIASIADRAAELTRQLLEVSGQATPDLAPLSLTELVTQAQPLLAETLSGRVRLVVELPSDPLPPIAGDFVRLRRALGDLVVNASEAIGDLGGKIRVAVDAIRLDLPLEPFAHGPSVRGAALAPGDYLRLSVSDDGIGMSPELQARIFDPFFSTKFTGRGLGLAAILGIVRSHRGALRVHSAPGQGTRFELYFPVLAPPGVPTRAKPAANERPGKQRLLVVDDEAQVRRVLTTALSGAGFEVIEAEAGATALELYDNDPIGFDLVLTDLTMPGIDGHALFCELTARDPRLPVILSSGYSDQQDAARYPDGTPATFLKKPYRLGHLLAKVHEELAKRAV